MHIALEIQWIVAVLLMACRLAPLFILVPVFGSSGIPARLKVLLCMALAALLVSGTGLTGSLFPLSFGALLAVAVVEIGIGLAFAFGLLTVFAAFSFAGRLLDLQIGFGVANLLDPVTNIQAPLLGTALSMLAVVVFFALDGHHLVLRGLAWSLDRLPPGMPVTRIDPQAVMKQFGLIFTHGLVLAAPAMFALLLLDVAFALVSRTMPQMNVFVMSMPLKLIVGLMMLAFSMNHLLPVMRKLFGTLPPYWHRTLGI